MKFRAVLRDPGVMKEFTNIANTISKLSKQCVLRLSEHKLYFIVSGENCGPAPPIMWCEIPHQMYFSEYQLVGLDEEHKDIYLSLSSGDLSRSLTTKIKSLKMKLTNKQGPCLTLELEVQTLSTLEIHHVTHDIPVMVVSRKDWPEYAEPKIPDPDITIELPPMKILRTAIERMRNVAGEITVRANSEGLLTLQIKTDKARVSTMVKNLRVHLFSGTIQHDSDSEPETKVHEDISKICYCKVDAKKLSIFFTAEQITHKLVLCSILHRKLIVLCLHTSEEVKLQCYIPGIVY